DHDRAIEDLTNAIELDSKSPAAWANRGAVRANKGDYDPAIADLTKALELDPEYAVAWANRGNAKHEKGDLEGAIADWERGLTLGLPPSMQATVRIDLERLRGLRER